MNVRSFLFASAIVVTSLASVARAEQISFFTDSITSADATRLGRPSRSGVQQTWTGAESYTGQTGTGTTYYYTTYDFAASDFTGAPYVEISVYDENQTTDSFVSAFAGSYNPANPGANWLGDEGSSGNYEFFAPPVPGDPRYFDVILPAGDDLILLVNSTLGGTNGLNEPFDINVAAYADTEYDDPIPAVVAPTPEPGTLLMTFTGLLGTLGVARRKFSARA